MLYFKIDPGSGEILETISHARPLEGYNTAHSRIKPGGARPGGWR